MQWAAWILFTCGAYFVNTCAESNLSIRAEPSLLNRFSQKMAIKSAAEFLFATSSRLRGGRIEAPDAGEQPWQSYRSMEDQVALAREYRQSSSSGDGDTIPSKHRKSLPLSAHKRDRVSGSETSSETGNPSSSVLQQEPASGTRSAGYTGVQESETDVSDELFPPPRHPVDRSIVRAEDNVIEWQGQGVHPPPHPLFPPSSSRPSLL
jgi:hypothetical protein